MLGTIELSGSQLPKYSLTLRSSSTKKEDLGAVKLVSCVTDGFVLISVSSPL